jgi:hypothetical protein
MGRGCGVVNFGIGAASGVNESRHNLLSLLCVEELQRIGIGMNGSSRSLCREGDHGGTTSVTLFN